MPFMEWDDTFELGIQEFDEHHKYLVGLLNTIFDGFTCEADYEELEAVLDELVAYATYHFAAEEHWMQVHAYPGLPQHSSEHERFRTKIAEFQREFRTKKADLSLDALQFLNNWLSDHIIKTDGEYGRFARGLPHESR
jgi:hemerythrin